MNGKARVVVVFVSTLVVVLLLLFVGEVMTKETLSGGMMGNGAMGIRWM